MRKKKKVLYLGMMIMFLFVDMLFLCNLVQDVIFVSHIQETTGTIVHIEEQTHDWDMRRKCEFSYTVDRTHYRGNFATLMIGEWEDISLGNQTVVSYSGENPNNARQGSAVKNIGIFILKCSVYILCNMVLMIGWMLRMTLLYRNGVSFWRVALR